MQNPKSTSPTNRFRALVRRHLKLRRLMRQSLAATLIAALVLVSLPMAERLTPPAQAQITVFARTCDPNNPIAQIQIVQGCKLGGPVPEGVLERDVINDLLKLHRLPASDSARLLGWERDEIRAGIYDKVISFIKKPADQRTANEQAVVNAVTNLVKARRVLAATKALDEFNRWRTNCPYLPPDPTKFTYTESPLCGGGLGGLFEGRTAPTFAEFQTYGAYLATRDLQEKPEIVQAARNMGRAYGFLGGITAAGVGAEVGANVGAALFRSAYTKAIFPYAGVRAGGTAVAGAVALSGPIGIILLAITVGVIQGIQVFEQEQIPTRLQEAKTNAENETVNLATVIANDNEAGLNQVFGEVLLAAFPDFPATTGVPAAQASDPKFEFRPGSAANFTPTSSLEYKDWDGNQHTVRLNGGWFVDRKGSGAERLALSIEFLNAEGRKRVATRSGSRFLISDVSDDNADESYTSDLHYRNRLDQTYVARIPDIAPVITALPVERRQEQPAPVFNPRVGAPTNFNISHIANISDNDLIETLNVAITSPLTSNGVTLSEFRVDPDGKVFARIQPSCTATDAAFTLQVTDGGNVTTTETINVTVARNETPVLAYDTAYAMPPGSSMIIQPTAGASDDGTNWGLDFPPPWTLGEPVVTPLDPSMPPFTGTVTHALQVGNTIYPNPAGPLQVSNAGPAGVYLVRVLITDSCFKTELGVFTLNVGTCVPIIWGHSLANPTCSGAGNGQITINANGGSGALKYSKDNGLTFQNSNVFNGLSADTYNLVVKDAAGCTTTSRTAALANPTAVTFTTTPVNPTCRGASNGRITVNAGGGTNSFTYSINGGSFVSSNVFTGLATGIYSIAVKDSNGCTAAAQTMTLTQPAALSLTPNSLPTAQAGIAFSQSFTAGGGTGTKNASLSGNLPNGLNFTPAANGGTLAGTPLQTGTFPLTLTVTDQNNCTLTQNPTLAVVCPTITLAPASLPIGNAGEAYSAMLTASPAAVNYNYTVSSGLLPTGLTLNATSGAITGTPTQTGVFSFRVMASGAGGCSRFADYQINISGCAPISVGPTMLAGGTIGAAYDQSVSATPSAAYSYSVTSGALPPGVTLNATTGTLSGAPTTPGTFNFRITATLGTCSGARDYSVTIGCAALSIAATLPAGQPGVAYNQAIQVTPAGSYSFSLQSGSLPTGLSLNTATGVLSGTPTGTGAFNFTVKAQTAAGCSATQALTLQIACATVTLSSLPTPTLKSPYNQTITATPAGSYSYVVTAGAMPAGLSLNAATGALTGTVAVAGTYNFTVTATGAGGCTGNRAYSFVIDAGGCPTIALPALPDGQPGQLYNAAITATPSGSYSYAVTSGSLPPGLTLFGSFGLVYGFPTSAGTFNFTVTASGLGDANNCTGAKSYSLVIGGAANRSLVFGDFDGDGKADLSVWRGASGEWLTLNSGDGKQTAQTWGTSAAPYFDVMTPGDYDGDGKMDLAVFRKSTGEWFVKRSSDGAVTTKLWGLGTDVPVPGDYDGDGQTDIAVWRGTDTNWYIVRSSDGQTQTVSWGTSKAPYNDVPVAADFDGDRKTDIAVFRQGNGHWYVRLSSDGSVVDKAWGLGSDVPVVADYDGDGKADIAVRRGSDTNWYIVRSSDGKAQSLSWGASSLGDVPAPADYDGDGKADAAVWLAATGNWQIVRSSDGKTISRTYGRSGDTPVPAKRN